MDYKYKPTDYAPKIDISRLPQPFTVRYGEPAAINVDVSGYPPPTVRWFVGKSLILNGGPQYRITNNGDCIHSLTMASVEDEIQKGVFVIATNKMGEDRCKVDIIPYKVHLSRHFIDVPNLQTYSVNDTVRRDKPKGRKKLRVLKHNKSLPSLGGSTSSLDIDENTDPKRTRLKSAEDLLRVRDSVGIPALHDPFSPGLLNQSSDSGFNDTRSMRRAKRFSSTDNVFDEVRSPTIPSLTMDFDSASSRLTTSMPTTPKIRRSFNFDNVSPYHVANENLDPNERVDYPMLTDEQLEQHAADEILDSVLYDDYDPHLWELSGVNLSSLCKTLIQDLKPVAEMEQENRGLSPSEKVKKKRKKSKSKDRLTTTTTEVTETTTILRYDELGNPVYETRSASLPADDQSSMYSQDPSRPSTTYSSMHSLNSEPNQTSESQPQTPSSTGPVKKRKKRKKKVETSTEITDTITTIQVDEYGNVIQDSPQQAYKEQAPPFIRELSQEPERLDYVQETRNSIGDETTSDTSMIFSPPGEELSPVHKAPKKRRKKRKIRGETTETVEVTETITTVRYDQYGNPIEENGTDDTSDKVLRETYRPDSIVSDVQYVEDGSDYFNTTVDYVATVPEGKEIQLIVTPVEKEKKRRKKKRIKEPTSELTSEQSTTETTETTEYTSTYTTSATEPDASQPPVPEEVTPIIEKKKRKKKHKSKSAIGVGRDLTLSREEVSTIDTITSETTVPEPEVIDNYTDHNRNSLGNQSWKGMEMIFGPHPGSEYTTATETEYTTGTEYTTETGSEYTTTTGPGDTGGTEYTMATTTDSEQYQQQPLPVEQEISPPKEKKKKRKKKRKEVQETNLDNVTIEETETYVETNIDTVSNNQLTVDNTPEEDNNNMYVTEIQVGHADDNLLNNNYQPQSPEQLSPDDVIFEPKDSFVHDISIGSANDVDLNSSGEVKSLEMDYETSFISEVTSPTSERNYESLMIDSALVNLQEQPLNLEEDYHLRRKSMGDLLIEDTLLVAPKECKSMPYILDDDFEKKNKIRRRTYSQEHILTLTTVRIEEDIIIPKKAEASPPPIEPPTEEETSRGKATGIFTNTTVTREKTTGAVETCEEVFQTELPPETVDEETNADDSVHHQLNKVELVIPSVDVDRDWYAMDPHFPREANAPRASSEEFDDSFTSSSSIKVRSRSSTLNEINDLSDADIPADSGFTSGLALSISQSKQIENEEKEEEVVPDDNTTEATDLIKTATTTTTSTTITEETVVTIMKAPEEAVNEDNEKVETFVGSIVIENPTVEEQSTIGGVGIFLESKEIEQPVIVDTLLPDLKEEIEPAQRSEEAEEEKELALPTVDNVENSASETVSTGIFESIPIIIEGEKLVQLPAVEETLYPSDNLQEKAEVEETITAQAVDMVIQDVVETTENTTVEEVVDTQIDEATTDHLVPIEKPESGEEDTIPENGEITEVTNTVKTTITTTTTEHVRDTKLKLASDKKSPKYSQTTNTVEPKVVRTEKLETVTVLAETGQSEKETLNTKKKDEPLPEVDPDSIVVYEYGELISYFRRDKVLTGDPKTADVIMYVSDPNDTGEAYQKKALRPERPGMIVMPMKEFSLADSTALEQIVESKETTESNVEKAHLILANDVSNKDKQISREIEIVETDIEYDEHGAPDKLDIAIDQMPSRDNEVDISLAVDETEDSKEIREPNAMPGVLNIILPNQPDDEMRGMQLVHEETHVYVTSGGDPEHILYSTSSTSIPGDSLTYSIAGRDEKTLAITSDVGAKQSTGKELTTTEAIEQDENIKEEQQLVVGSELVPVDDSQNEIENLPPHQAGFGMGNVFVKVVTAKDGKIEGISIVTNEGAENVEEQSARPLIKHVDVGAESSEEYTSGEFTSESESEESPTDENLIADEGVYGKYDSCGFPSGGRSAGPSTAQQQEIQAKTVTFSEEDCYEDSMQPGHGSGYSHDQLQAPSTDSESGDDNDDDLYDDTGADHNVNPCGGHTMPTTSAEEDMSTGIFASSYAVTSSDINSPNFVTSGEGDHLGEFSTEEPSSHSVNAGYFNPYDQDYSQDEGFPDPPTFETLQEETEPDEIEKTSATFSTSEPNEPSSQAESKHSNSSNQDQMMTELRQRIHQQEDDSTVRRASQDPLPGGAEGGAPRDPSPKHHQDDVIVQKAFLEGVIGSVGTMIFLILAALIFHVLTRYMDELDNY